MTHFTAGAWLLALSGMATVAQAQSPVLFRELEEAPESITTDESGNLYLSVGNTIQRISPDGDTELFGTLPIAAFALGVKVGPDGCVYNASTSLDAAVVGAFVWRICEQGVVEEFAALDPAGGPNDLAFDAQGNLFVTDPILGQIYKIDEAGAVSVWLDDPLLKGDAVNPVLGFSRQGVNGLAFDKRGRHLYVGNLDYGRILEIEVDRQSGQAGAIRVFAESPELRGADGIAFDKQGRLYVAVLAQDQLVSVSKQGEVAVVAEDGLLNGPSSLVFSAGDDRRTLYIAGSDFLRVFGIVQEPADPNVVTLRTPKKGLPLLD